MLGLKRMRLGIRVICQLGSMTLLLSAAVGLCAGGGLSRPFSLNASDPAALSAPDVKTEGVQGRISKNRVMGMSADKHFRSGLYSSELEKENIDSYPVDEFMYFIKGGVTLTSADGTVTRVNAGDAVHVPKGWKGVWDTTGYTKFYVVYDPEKK
jgi:ethanolamine utilization protein EutQ